MRPCFAFSNVEAADKKPALLSIYEDIGFWGVQASDFIAALGAVKGDTLEVEINSPGGDAFAATAMYNALRASGKTIVTKVMGVAASAASLVFMAGDKRVMPKNTHLMVHNPWTIAAGNAEAMRDTADMLEKVGTSLRATYAARSGMSDEDVTALLAKDTWLTADESLEKGLATEVVEEVKATAKFDMDRAELPEHVRAVFAKAKPATSPAPAPAPAAQVAFADQVVAVAKEAGFEVHAATWATAFKTVDEVKARIGVAREINSLCALAKHADKANGFVSAGKSLDEVRAALQDLLADGQTIDTTLRQSAAGAPQLTSAGAFDKRRKAIEAKNTTQPANKEDAGQPAGRDAWAKRRQQITNGV